MGEVHVKVRLSNAEDIAMVDRGLLDPAKVRQCEVDAIVDTGATRSVIPQRIADQLGLPSHGESVATLADGRPIRVRRSGVIYFEIEGRDVPEDAYIMGDTVLIGQTVLELTDLLVDCTNRKVIPNPAHPDGPVLRI
jgi:clan AA aspartic protease